MTCPKCKKPIGAIQKGIFQTEDKIVNRDNYYRIFKDDKIEEIKKDKDKRSKLKEIKFMTLEQYKENYIYKEEKKEKGVFINIDENDFKNDNKIIRNLRQISFRLLNYILFVIYFLQE